MPMTLGEAVLRYWDEIVQSQRSYRSTQCLLDKLVGHFGSATLISDIGTETVLAFVSARQREISRYGRPYSPLTINKELHLLRRHFIRAEQVWGIKLRRIDWSSLWLQKPQPRRRILMPPEEERLLTVAAEHLRPAIRFSLLTGFRLGNTVSLDWSQIDLSADILSVKTKGDRYLILPITPRLIPIVADRDSHLGFP